METRRIPILAIMGKAGAGKDTVLNRLITSQAISNSAPIISCTTRPKRDYEEDDKDYHFLTDTEFAQAIMNFEMLEAQEFNGWSYGTRYKDLHTDKINIGVFNPEGIYDISTDKNINLCVIYLLASDKTRLLRQLNREKDPDVHEIIRRYSTDEMDFDIEQIKLIIKNCNHFYTIESEANTPSQIVEAIKTITGQYWLKN